MRGSLEAHAIARDIVSPSPSKAPPALDMMRYQRLSPECLPLSNGAAAAVGGGRKLASRSCKEDDTPGVATDGSRLASYLATSPLRARTSQAPAPPSSAAGPSPARDHAPHPSDSSDTASPSSTGGGGGVGDVLLQWGHNKRSRCRRDPAAASTAAPSPQRRQAGAKIQRRASAPAEKLMPPPPAAGSYTRGSNLRATSSFPARGAGDGHQSHHPLNHLRSAEERSGGQPRADKRSPDKPHKSTMDAVMHTDLTSNHHHLQSNHHHHDLSLTANGAVSGEKLALERFELPRIYISLSRKEKEDDFLAMKGTKLPQRPKKRAKNVDKTLQYVFPGMWLSDLTRGRYEVREKKCVKKKRRGLKGMESMDSDSDWW